MSSPVMSSPLSISRRQSLSPSEISVEANSVRHPRHSPTLTRSFDPNDPQVRERQRTMDVDMAMQLSLARRDTLHSSPVNTFSSPATLSGQPQASSDHSFPLSPENEDHRLLEEVDDRPLQDTPFEMSDDNEPESDHAASRSMHLDRTAGVDNMGMDIPSLGHLHSLPPLHRHHSNHSLHLHIHPEDPQSSTFGLPTYQATNASQTMFNFGPMEEWATAEKTKLGLNSSPLNPRFSFAPRPKVVTVKPQIVSIDTPAIDPTSSTSVVPANESDNAPSGSGHTSQVAEQPTVNTSDDPNRPLRFRKLSQSNPHPRSHRKGIGGKMALFETNLNDAPSFSARLGLVLGNQGGPITSEPSYDHMHNANSVGGILNTGHDRPYRFSFYSNALSATIHARSLSELPAEGQTFEQMFSGINPPTGGEAAGPTRQDRVPPFSPPYTDTMKSTPGENAGGYFPNANNSTLFMNHDRSRNVPNVQEKGFGGNGVGMNGGPGAPNEDANTWWLDVLNPTDEEMKMLSKVFNIHPLTTEDILMEETREKIELFRNYYLVCFRSFDQDPYSPTHLEPLNMYIIVFRQGTLSFHFRPTPHPQNVRRRIKQLKDYISVTSDWISYALIDDITDAFGPLIQGIEYEVDSIDELVLILKEAEQSDMLRRIGTCRKKVMGLLRLMGNKADVVKGLAKRCNENWRVAPTSDIGLYLSDIQDHLITMTQNLNHYEKILSRSHSNYLAQISIEMTDANNQINDVLSKMTALGTVLIPMNLVTGLWGMNVHVPGQEATVR
ncbi:hypothetical protein CPB84DRAFT_76115 [Gymnopilus junonius]|uniref:Uncharacterized protein n=1 Tax=Gymnopilus junonius TaxID=109634 RepID=A0A9P5P4M5_GYMJU|nr:hypothetical protein CPB84DRAFT_76115 [Gymnopilus junonius]